MAWVWKCWVSELIRFVSNATYTIDEPSNSITVMIEASSYPNFVGETQKRTLSVSGDELQVINAAPSGGGGVATQIWKRAK